MLETGFQEGSLQPHNPPPIDLQTLLIGLLINPLNALFTKFDDLMRSEAGQKGELGCPARLVHLHKHLSRLDTVFNQCRLHSSQRDCRVVLVLAHRPPNQSHHQQLPIDVRHLLKSERRPVDPPFSAPPRPSLGAR